MDDKLLDAALDRLGNLHGSLVVERKRSEVEIRALDETGAVYRMRPDGTIQFVKFRPGKLFVHTP